MTMASTQETRVPEVYRCYHCGAESADSSFKYFDNKKADQPRYQCRHCQKFFTLGWHGRRQGKTYAKKRNEDPAELKPLSRQCRHCGVADHAVFKYYNNHNLSQPRFKCLSCGKQFQMRLLGTGEERRLVHTSAQKTSAPRRPKQSVPEPFPNASNNSCEEGTYQPYDGAFMPMPSSMPLESGGRLLPEMSDEDLQYSDFLEDELTEQENAEVDPLSGSADGDDRNLPPPWSDEVAEYAQFLEAELFTEENNEAPNADASSSTANVDGELPPPWSNEDSQFMDFVEPPFVDMGSESTSENVEVMYGTRVVDAPTVSDSSDSWSQNDPSRMSYADAAAACCQQMDLEMARQNSMAGSEGSSSSVGSTLVFGDAFRVIPEPLLVQQAFTEDEQCSEFHWNEEEEDTEMNSWAY